MEPWGILGLTWILVWRLQFRTTRSRPLLRKDEIRSHTSPHVPYDSSLWKKQHVTTHWKLWIYQVHSSSGPGPINNTSISIRVRWSKTMLEITRVTSLSFTSFSKILLTKENKNNRAVVFSNRPYPQQSQKQGPQMRPSNDLENKIISDTYWRVQLVCMKVQTHSVSQSPMEYNENQMPLVNKGWLWPS